MKKPRKAYLSPTQKLLLSRMKAGKRLMWYGRRGPELQGCSGWPQKVTVRRLLAIGALQWGTPNNETQDRAGIHPVILNPAFQS